MNTMIIWSIMKQCTTTTATKSITFFYTKCKIFKNKAPAIYFNKSVFSFLHQLTT